VYSFIVNKEWQQVTFYNDEAKALTIAAPLSGDQASTGSLGLDATKKYYVYEFWSNKLVGKFAGSETLSQNMLPGEARMFSVREVLNYPQILSTNRHLMQGYVDLEKVKWDVSKKQLSGIAKVVGGEAFRIAIARNGMKGGVVKVEGAVAKLETLYPDICVLVLDRPENGDVSWSISF
jgi:hypothetical protein